MKHIRIRVTSFAKVNKRTVILGDTGIKIVETSENDSHIFCNPKTLRLNESCIPSFLKTLMGKWYQIILIKFHPPARLQATGNDGFKHKVTMSTLSRDNFYGNHKLLHHKQQQQQRQWRTQVSSLEMVRCTSPTAAKHCGYGGDAEGEGVWCICNTKTSFIPCRQCAMREWNTAVNDGWRCNGAIRE